MLRSNSVEEFLNDADIVDSDLRDLCLKLEDPSLQQIRDACADFARGDDAEEAEDMSDESDTDDEDGDTFADMVADNDRYAYLHTDEWLAEKLFPDELKPPQGQDQILVTEDSSYSMWQECMEPCQRKGNVSRRLATVFYYSQRL